MPGIDRQCGPCCVQQCKFPHLELCPAHKCINCNQIIHVVCGMYDQSTEEYRCPIDCRKAPAVVRTPPPPPPIDRTPPPTSNNNNTNPLKHTSFYYIGKSESEEEAKKRYKPVVDVASADFEPIKTVFKVFNKNYRGRYAEVEPTPEVLTKEFLSKGIVSKMVLASNQYRANRLNDYPDLNIWRRKSDSAPFTMKCMYQYLAILMYMGIVKLPCKDDYWSTDEVMPSHSLCNMWGMNRNRFRFLFRHFHILSSDQDDEDEIGGGGDSDEEIEVEVEARRNMDNGEDIFEATEERKEVWFNKLRPLVDSFRKTSQKMVFTLGSNLSIDEMIIQFQG